ncbi:hypothetical protein PH213_42185 [Streptomyces sp. SRF1]|uniref:hypothetical protein n=1 Tax=Streptomyces sp. SRF1 TaxID=1549642 RepID=UPI0025B027E9|nr:hypothetical protein [Streptomyces sp. SRF1]MDN3060999.1 hypothetical protein [Streptomyces sp. SRF1]
MDLAQGEVRFPDFHRFRQFRLLGSLWACLLKWLRLDALLQPGFGALVACTKSHWSAPKLIVAANTEVSGANVRILHVSRSASGDVGFASVSPS